MQNVRSIKLYVNFNDEQREIDKKIDKIHVSWKFY